MSTDSSDAAPVTMAALPEKSVTARQGIGQPRAPRVASWTLRGYAGPHGAHRHRERFCAVPSASSFEARAKSITSIEVSVDLVEFDVIEATLVGLVLTFERLCASSS
jgi:hypothetical protein